MRGLLAHPIFYLITITQFRGGRHKHDHDFFDYLPTPAYQIMVKWLDIFDYDYGRNPNFPWSNGKSKPLTRDLTMNYPIWPWPWKFPGFGGHSKIFDNWANSRVFWSMPPITPNCYEFTLFPLRGSVRGLQRTLPRRGSHQKSLQSEQWQCPAVGKKGASKC